MGKATDVIFKTEFPRYVYRRMVLEEANPKSAQIHSVAEIMAQAFSNISVLVLPGFLLAVNTSTVIPGWEISGVCIWVAAYVLESMADTQKLLFISNNKGGVCSVCDVGLWRYCRHPNYFAEWLVWTGLVVATVPSWLTLRGKEACMSGSHWALVR